MIIFKEPTDIHEFLIAKKKAQVLTGFVPTMGALHEGHIGLITRAKNESQLVICSIFVNPTQFNDPADFKKYPNTIEKDILLLEKAGCDILFLPSVEAIYPIENKTSRMYELGFLATVLEGKFRPGHFQGVCQVVHRLLNIVIPGKLYLGQKDFQQCMVIAKLVELINCDTQIIICPTQRETDGLAMSSRNLRLNEAERKMAPLIYKTLQFIKNHFKTVDFRHLKENAQLELNKSGFKVDYIEIAEAENFNIPDKYIENKKLVVLCAAFLNEVRLIDNIILNDAN